MAGAALLGSRSRGDGVLRSPPSVTAPSALGCAPIRRGAGTVSWNWTISSSSCWLAAQESACIPSPRIEPSRRCTSAGPTGSSTSPSATASTRVSGGLHRDPVQVALAEPPQCGWGGVSSARSLASSSRSCRPRNEWANTGISELPTRYIRTSTPLSARPRDTSSSSVGRSRVQDGLREDAAVPRRKGRSRNARDDRSADRRGAPLRDRRCRRGRSCHRVRGEAAHVRPDARITRRRAGVDGHLHLQGRRADARRSRTMPRVRQPARLREEHHPVALQGRRRSSRTASTTRTRRPRNAGATSGRSTPTTKPAWICVR